MTRKAVAAIERARKRAARSFFGEAKAIHSPRPIVCFGGWMVRLNENPGTLEHIQDASERLTQNILQFERETIGASSHIGQFVDTSEVTAAIKSGQRLNIGNRQLDPQIVKDAFEVVGKSKGYGYKAGTIIIMLEEDSAPHKPVHITGVSGTAIIMPMRQQ